MTTPRSMLYSGLGLPYDRAHRLREGADPKSMLAHPRTRVTLFWRGLQLVEGDPPAAAWMDGPAAAGLPGMETAPLSLLALEGETTLISADLSALEGGEDGPDLGRGHWVMLRSVGGQMSAADAALLAYARGLTLWRQKARFCPSCATPLDFVDAGHSARCPNPACATQHFPRTDPAVIMLIVDPLGRALLGRQPVWKPGMYSCLAGFVEPGESLEEAVVRESWEEAGIIVTASTYFASQPWPFPASLMVGFRAEAGGEAPNPDKSEIEDARWFTRDEVRRFGEAAAPGQDGLFLPSRDSISRALIEAWLREG